MRPVCQAERAAAHYEPPEQRTAGDPGADVSDGESTNQANRHDELIHLITVWTSEALSEKLTDCWCTSKACWILSLLPASPGRQELNDCVFSEICPPSRLSSGSRVSDHSLHTPSSQDVSSTLHTEPLEREGERNRLTNQYFVEHLHFRNSRTSTSNTNT